MSIIKGANAHGLSVSDDHLKRRGPHNQKWLVEDLLPLGAVKAGWSNDDRIDFNLDLLDLGLQVAHPVDEHPRWRDQRVMTRGAAALLYGRAEWRLSGRLILLDPKRPKHFVTEANHKLFECDAYGRYRLSQAGTELEQVLLSTKDLRLIVFNLFWPFLPDGFGAPGKSLPAWAWLRKLSADTGAAVLAMADGPEQLELMWRKGIRLAAERRPPQEGVK
jgi:hypothetical protein